jgi:hypothetical protein
MKGQVLTCPTMPNTSALGPPLHKPPFGDKVSALAQDFGISFIGSMKGIGTTVAERSPLGQ